MWSHAVIEVIRMSTENFIDNDCTINMLSRVRHRRERLLD